VILIILLTVLVLIGFGCTRPGEVNDSTGSVTSTDRHPCLHPFYPLQVGYKVTYESRQRDGKPLGIHSWSVVSADSDSVTIKYAYPDQGQEMEHVMRCEGGALISSSLLHQNGFDETGTMKADARYIEGVHLPAEVMPGVEWNSAFEIVVESPGQTGEGSYQMTSVLKSDSIAVGVESVTVPAGTFESVRVETMRSVSMPSVPGFSVPSIEIRSVDWLVKDVGLVKSETLAGQHTDVIIEAVEIVLP